MDADLETQIEELRDLVEDLKDGARELREKAQDLREAGETFASDELYADSWIDLENRADDLAQQAQAKDYELWQLENAVHGELDPNELEGPDPFDPVETEFDEMDFCMRYADDGFDPGGGSMDDFYND